jgi:O-antigen ligase
MNRPSPLIKAKSALPWHSARFRTDFKHVDGMSGLLNILPWITSFLMALGIVGMQAIGGGGRPMFPLMVCYLPILAAGILALPAILLGNGRRSPERLGLGSALVFGAFLLGRTCFGGDPGLRTFELLRLAACMLVYLITVGAVTAKGPRFLFLGMLMAAAFFQTLLETYQLYCDRGWFPLLEWLPFLKVYYAETVGSYANKNHLAWLLGDAALAAVALACWGRLRWVTRAVFVYLFLFLGFGVCSSFSRGGVVGLIMGLAMLAAVSLLLLFLAGDSRKLMMGIFVGLLIAAAAAVIFVFLSSNPVLGLRMKGLWMDDYREELWRASIHDLGNAPFLGNGAGSFQWCARLMMPVESLLAHNDYAQLLSEYGLVGFFLLVVFLSAHLRSALSSLLRHHGDGKSGSPSDAKALLLVALAVIAAQMAHSALDFNTHLASNALLSAFFLGILAGNGLHEGHHDPSQSMRGLLCLFVALLVGVLGFLLFTQWDLEHRFFRLEQRLASKVNPPGSRSLTPIATESKALLDEAPGNSRYADFRVGLYRRMISKPETGFSEPGDRFALSRQLERILPVSGGDWYLWMNQGYLLGHLGEEEDSKEAFLQAMVCMPLFAMVYTDKAAVLEDLGDPEEALHNALIACRFKDAPDMEPTVRRLEAKILSEKQR